MKRIFEEQQRQGGQLSSSLAQPPPQILPCWVEAYCQRLYQNDTSLLEIVQESHDKEMDAYACRTLAEALRKSTKCPVQKIHLRTGFISPFSLQDILKTLKDHSLFSTSLQTLILEDCIGLRGATALKEILQQTYYHHHPKSSGLQEVVLDLKYEGDANGSKIVAEVFRGLQPPPPPPPQQQHPCCVSNDGNNNNNNNSKNNSNSNAPTSFSSSLQTLQIRNRRFKIIAVMELAKMLRTNTSLQTLKLHCNKIDDALANMIADALEENQTLTCLELCHQEIGDDGAISIMNAATTTTKSTTTLSTTGLAQSSSSNHQHQHQQQQQQQDGDDDQSNQVAALKDIQLCNNSIGTRGFIQMGLILKQRQESSSSIQSLGLNYNNICGMGAMAFARFLPSLKLTSLSLNNNCNIGDIGAAAILKSIQHHKYLKELHLAWNRIGDHGVAPLEETLCTKENSCTALTTINLSFNVITSAGTKAIAKGMKHNSTLRHLNLGYNEIDCQGAKALATLLASNQSPLQDLVLISNPIQEDGSRALVQSLKWNVMLENSFSGEALFGDNINHRYRNSGDRKLEDKQCYLDLKKESTYYMQLNSAGRKFWREPNLPPALWPQILASLGDTPMLLYHLVRGKPELFKM